FKLNQQALIIYGKLEKNIKSTVSVNIENHFLHYKQIPFFVYDDFGRKSQTHK
ncbi:hypothetical protein HMPREF1548_00172, partial [Clostridium sp. KLE 1755]